MTDHLAAIASTGGAAWLCWRLIRPVLKWIALLGVLIVLLAVNLRGSLLAPDSQSIQTDQQWVTINP